MHWSAQAVRANKQWGKLSLMGHTHLQITKHDRNHLQITLFAHYILCWRCSPTHPAHGMQDSDRSSYSMQETNKQTHHVNSQTSQLHPFWSRISLHVCKWQLLAMARWRLCCSLVQSADRAVHIGNLQWTLKQVARSADCTPICRFATILSIHRLGRTICRLSKFTDHTERYLLQLQYYTRLRIKHYHKF